MRTLLGLGPDGDGPRGTPASRPTLPDWLDHVEVHGIRLPDGSFADLSADAASGIDVRPARTA